MNKAVVACLAGLTVFMAAEGIALAMAVNDVKTNGINVNLPGVGPINLRGGDNNIVTFPPTADKVIKNMHIVAGVSGVGAILLVAALLASEKK